MIYNNNGLIVNFQGLILNGKTKRYGLQSGVSQNPP